MAAFRILDQFPAYLGDDGRPLIGGYLMFYEAGTTNPKDVYGDIDLTVNNGSRVDLNAAGRTEVDVWGDGDYRVRLYSAANVLIAEADDVEIPGGATAAIPIPEEGEFVTGDGTQFLVQTLLLLPDPTGQDGKAVVADGNGYVLQPFPETPEIPTPDIVINTVLQSFLAGTSDEPTKFAIVTGSATAPASPSSQSTSVDVTFNPPLGTAWIAIPMPTISSCTPNGGLPQWSVPSLSATGATFRFYTGDENNGGNSNKITNSITFRYIAIGTREVS